MGLTFRPPKDVDANLRFRKVLLKRAEGNKGFQQQMIAACASDILFWLNCFAWVYEPRRAKVLPFITWPFQDKTLKKMIKAITADHRDVGIEKSRDMGASWMALAVITWLWLFREMQSFLLISRTEDEVDKTDDSDTLFWKVDFLRTKLPKWMQPNLSHGERTNLHLLNPLNGSLIDGRSTTGNVGRGGRRTAVLMDEFAAFAPQDGYRALSSTQFVTDCRLFISTPQGGAGPFFDVMHKKDLNVERIRLHWSEHPLKKKGLYTTKQGKLHVLDKPYRYPKDYQHILDGKIRSPWYDNECRRMAIPQLIAQEVDIDYLASSYQYFDSAVLNELSKATAMQPHFYGDLDYTLDTIAPKGLIERSGGPLVVWGFIDHLAKPKKARYAIGCDVSGGTGASPTAMCVGDADTGEQVALYVNNRIDPKAAGRYAVALARLFEDSDGTPAKLIWEANGPTGRNFGDAVIATGFRNFYYRRVETSLSSVPTDTPGWYSNKEEKAAVLGDWREALQARTFICRDEETLREAAEYVHTTNGSIEHNGAVNTVDLSDSGTNHGDRVIAAALCHKGMGRRIAVGAPARIAFNPPVGSVAHRHMVVEERAKRELANAW